MKLDNEEQKKQLLQVIASVNVNGNYANIRAAIATLDKLAEAVNNASIEKEGENK